MARPDRARTRFLQAGNKPTRRLSKEDVEAVAPCAAPPRHPAAPHVIQAARAHTWPRGGRSYVDLASNQTLVDIALKRGYDVMVRLSCARSVAGRGASHVARERDRALSRAAPSEL